MQQIFSHVRENLGNANATGTMITVVNLSVILHYRLKHQPSLKKKKKALSFVSWQEFYHGDKRTTPNNM